MVIDLPAPIAGYFEADGARDASAAADCFTTGAVVHDDGHVHTGRDAIRGWIEDYFARYNSFAEPFAIAEEGGRTVVSTHVAGDFPGSPIDLRYMFTLADGGISDLEVKP
ncbi:nuclear transport factor 2 family protein [Sphingomonas crocodyli]|uniref:Nuclear transport factor 2 family protein n=1 Tax=Sphingomonas crocodyli TaxID=1979270 RepID=A0A437M178_9SPHN|nr:nuclear transport factor 2 family protein [Sphingomonas crocodyli]RVT91346.1 nuclear transport factor 2 family protein [Sphingomonas crocodyli]